MVADIIASFFIAVLSGMGVGSGGLFVIFLTLVSDTPQLTAQGLNLLFFLFSSGTSMLIHLNKRKILWGAVLTMALIGIAGSFAGSFVAGLLPVGAMRKMFGIMLMTTGAFSLFNRKKNRDTEKGTGLAR